MTFSRAKKFQLLFIFALFFVLSQAYIPSFDCKNLGPSLEELVIGKPTYKTVKDWKDANHTYHYIAKFQQYEELYPTSKVVRCLHIVLEFYSKNTFRLKISDATTQRWEIPETEPFPHYPNPKLIPMEESSFTVNFYDPFAFSIINKETKEVIFDTRDSRFIYTDYYIELSTKLPSNLVYGFGERAYKFKLKAGTYTMWGRDKPDVLEDGRGGGNIYSHHPTGLFRGEKGNFFVSFMRNSNAKDVVIDHRNVLTYKMVGGIVDLVFFIGDEYPDTAVKMYHEYVGKAALMPFWSMGYHQSRWGYKNIGIYESLIENFKKYDIPLDVLWSDVDYMIEKETFTVDTVNFPPDKMKKMIKDNNIKWVPIIDCGIKVERINHQKVYSRAIPEGIKRDIFLRNKDGNYMLSKVWPGACFYPDFFHPNATEYWFDMLEDLYNIIPFSGLWIDMNEVTNFADGECSVLNGRLMEQSGRIDSYHHIPYLPGNRNLEIKTSSMDAVHHGGLLEYNVHELFSLMQSEATFDYMKSKTKLPFILSRATFPSGGKYTAHWSGDNAARWEFLQYSIPGVFNFQIFNMPFVGSDICGFMRTTTPELCLRWYQTGAFYPFTRNHNNDMALDQEPWVFLNQHLGKELLGTAQATLKTRYSILKWYYSLFVATRGLGTVFKPLFFEFPHEEILYANDGPTESQFLLGSSLMVSPNVRQYQTKYTTYFPLDTWFDFHTGQKIMDKETRDRFVDTVSPYNASAPMYIRAGHIIHIQDVSKVLNTEDLNDQFELVIALKRNSTTNKLESKGAILGIKKYDEDTVYDKCVEGNCIYDIHAIVSKERINEMTLLIKFTKQQKSDLALERLGIFSLKIYNLPLNFMEEDDVKIANTMSFLYDVNDRITHTILTKEAISVSQDAFQIKLIEPTWVKDGDYMSIKMLL